MSRRLALLVLLTACAAERPAIEVRSAYSYAPVTGTVAAAYFTVENHTSQADTLVSVEVAGAPVAMVHEQVPTGDMVEMRHVEALPLAPQGTVFLKPGGLHVMIEGFTRTPVVGDTLRLTLRFARAGAVVVAAPVLTYGAAR